MHALFKRIVFSIESERLNAEMEIQSTSDDEIQVGNKLRCNKLTKSDTASESAQ